MRNLAVALPLALSAVAVSNPGSATNMFDPSPVENCGSINCGARVISGTVLLSSGIAVPWVAEIAARKDECLRIDLTIQSVDLEAVLIAPSGAVYRKDNRSPGDLKPLIKAKKVPVSGWYTLQISQKDGLPVNTDFTLLYGRYPAGDGNCLLGTDPL